MSICTCNVILNSHLDLNYLVTIASHNSLTCLRSKDGDMLKNSNATVNNTFCLFRYETVCIIIAYSYFNSKVSFIQVIVRKNV